MPVAKFLKGDHAFWKHPFFFVAISMALWDACLFLPSLQVAFQSVPGTGWNYLMVGWIGPVGGHFEWYANPALLLSGYFLLKRSGRASLTFSVIALILMSILLFTRNILTDEGGGRHAITAFLVGYWLWVGCAVVLFIGACVQISRSKKIT